MLSTSLLPDVAVSIDQDPHRDLFDSLDGDSTGRVSVAQLAGLIERDCEAINLQLLGIDASTAATLLAQKVGAAGDESLTYPQFHELFSSSSATTTTPSLATRTRTVGDWYATHKIRVWWLVAYAVANVVAFWWAFYSYQVDAALRYGLRIARGGAKIAILNAFLVMLPLLRSLAERLKRSTLLWRYVPFDDAITIHKICGSMCLLGGAIHVGAHTSNMIHLYLIATPDEIQRSIFGQRHVPVFHNGLPPFTTMLRTQPVWTGIVLILLSLIAFPLAAISRLRQGRFNLFWYSHMLFGLLLVVLCFHDAASWVVRATSYIWIVPILTLYLLERRFRYAKVFTDPVAIVDVKMLDRACAVYLEKPRRFVHRPGMYLDVNCPAISYHEWHPFTISSAPSDPYLSIHMRDAGDWTRAFHKLIADSQTYPRVYLDGPSGAPAEAFQRYSTSLCVAGGIGITPFASILRDAVHRWDVKEATAKRKIYVHWMTRDQAALSWLQPTMDEIHHTQELVDIQQCLTGRKQDAAAVERIQTVQRIVYEATGRDVLSGRASQKTVDLGYPHWDRIFQDACVAHAGETVGVFSCGPPALDRTLHMLCKQYSRRTAGGTVFEYHPERFT